MIPALIVDILLPVLIAIIATHYPRFYGHYCQSPEPFTRWFSRIAEAFPWFWKPLQGSLILFSALTAIFAPWYWAIIGVYGLLFEGWFVWHIVSYINEHQIDNPPIQFKARLQWIGRLNVYR